MFTALCLTLLFASEPQAKPKTAKGPAPKYEVHEWSLWALDPSSGRLNAKEAYPSALPAFVDSLRPEEKAGAPAVAPVTVMTFYGQPVHELELEIQLKAATALAHWPKAEIKNRRLKWSGLSLAPTCTDEARLAYTGEGHWFQQLRSLPNTLFISLGVRNERMLAYDTEVTLAVPLKVEGGPDRFKVANQSAQQLHDVVLSVPAPDGRRIAWIDALLPGKPNPKAAPAKPAAPPRPPRAATSGMVTVVRALPGGVVVREMLEAPTAVASSTPAKAAAPATAAGPPVEAVLSAPLKGSAPDYEQKTAAELRTRLERAGLNPAESKLLAAQAAKALFATDEFMIAARLDPVLIEELLPQEFFPEPTKKVRVALVLIRGIDPRLDRDIAQLITQLGDPKFSRREAAEERLKKIGSTAFPALKEALKHSDVEIVYRAERLLGPQNPPPAPPAAAQ